jgi:hypothetical protein
MIKLLFIGNSHTYYNDMVAMFKEKCHENNMDVHVTMLTHGGKTLLWHSDEHEVRFNILFGDYDYVILQDAAHPFGGEESLLNGVEKIKKYIDQTKTKTILYMTWAEKSSPQNQKKMSSAYKNVAKKTNSLLAPVGEYWEDIIFEYPNIELFAKDGEHSSQLGSYLTSNILYYSIFEKIENININSILEDHK